MLAKDTSIVPGVQLNVVGIESLAVAYITIHTTSADDLPDPQSHIQDRVLHPNSGMENRSNKFRLKNNIHEGRLISILIR